MNEDAFIHILPYTSVVGQKDLKLALELAYIAPRIGGVLLSGERGTGKSTIVRSFALMINDDLPVTIPINATEDRVVGGWQIDALMRSDPQPQMGLLEEAKDKLLYVDEINLLDDHIVNIVLDVTSTGMLVIQREGQSEQKPVSFTLVGTMNPEEGSLRPQLLDRFGLLVIVKAEKDPELRKEILRTVLDFDKALFQLRHGQPTTFFEKAKKVVERYGDELRQAKENLYSVEVPESIAATCTQLASKFDAQGHRGDFVLVLAAQACAARRGEKLVTNEHLRAVAPMVLQHRRPGAIQLNRTLWSDDDKNLLLKELADENHQHNNAT